MGVVASKMRIITRKILASEGVPSGQMYPCDECGARGHEAMVEIDPPSDDGYVMHLCLVCSEKVGRLATSFGIGEL